MARGEDENTGEESFDVDDEGDVYVARGWDEDAKTYPKKEKEVSIRPKEKDDVDG